MVGTAADILYLLGCTRSTLNPQTIVHESKGGHISLGHSFGADTLRVLMQPTKETSCATWHNCRRAHEVLPNTIGVPKHCPSQSIALLKRRHSFHTCTARRELHRSCWSSYLPATVSQSVRHISQSGNPTCCRSRSTSTDSNSVRLSALSLQVRAARPMSPLIPSGGLSHNATDSAARLSMGPTCRWPASGPGKGCCSHCASCMTHTQCCKCCQSGKLDVHVGSPDAGACGQP